MPQVAVSKGLIMAKKETPAFDHRTRLGWCLVSFFCAIKGVDWDDLPLMERRQVHDVIAEFKAIGVDQSQYGIKK